MEDYLEVQDIAELHLMFGPMKKPRSLWLSSKKSLLLSEVYLPPLMSTLTVAFAAANP